MKRIIAILLALLLALSLAACGGKKSAEAKPAQSNEPLTREDNAPLTREDPQPLAKEADNAGMPSTGGVDAAGDMDIEDIVNGANRNNMTPEQIAVLEADAAANGYELQWQADGSLVIVEDGHAVSLNGNWPDNEYTQGIPAPDFAITMSSDDGSGFTAVFGEVTKVQVKDYAEVLKKAGFVEDAEITDQDVAGMTIYMYSAGHADGRLAELMFTGAQNALTISK